jgi:ribose transport system permease protein
LINLKNTKFDRSDQLLIITSMMFIGAALVLGKNFIVPRNFTTVLTGFVPVGFVAIGMMMLLISGVFDLSVGSVFAMGMVTVAYFITDLQLPWPVAMIASLAVCGCCGAVNGLIVTRMKINPLIATLATMGILRGVAIMLGGVGKGGLPAEFKAIGNTKWLGLGLPVWFFFITAILFILMFRYLKFFRKFYFVGGNREAAGLCGINGDRVWFSGFVIMSLLAGFAGILNCSRLGSSSGQAGEGLEMAVIAGVVIGGASIKGGKGTILGGIMGAYFMAMVFNIISIGGVDAYWQYIVNGTILILAAYTDIFMQQGHFNMLLGKFNSQNNREARDA